MIVVMDPRVRGDDTIVAEAIRTPARFARTTANVRKQHTHTQLSAVLARMCHAAAFMDNEPHSITVAVCRAPIARDNADPGITSPQKLRTSGSGCAPDVKRI
jgi:hypothetical protein